MNKSDVNSEQQMKGSLCQHLLLHKKCLIRPSSKETNKNNKNDAKSEQQTRILMIRQAT
jgi:hypothetical protein